MTVTPPTTFIQSIGFFFSFPSCWRGRRSRFPSRSHSFIWKLAPVECSRLNGEGGGTGTAANWTEKQAQRDSSQGNKSSSRLWRRVIFFFFFFCFQANLDELKRQKELWESFLCPSQNLSPGRANGKGGITTSILTRFLLLMR